MSSPLSTRRVREFLVGLRRLIAERAKSEAEIKSRFEARVTAERVAGEREAERMETAARTARTAADQEYQQNFRQCTRRDYGESFGSHRRYLLNSG